MTIDLTELFRAELRQAPLTDLDDDLLHAVLVARPTSAEDMTAIAEQFVSLRPGQYMAMFLAWQRAIQHSDQEQDDPPASLVAPILNGAQMPPIPELLNGESSTGSMSERGIGGFPLRTIYSPATRTFNADIDLSRPSETLVAVGGPGGVTVRWEPINAVPGERTVYLVVGGAEYPANPRQGQALALTAVTEAIVDHAVGPRLVVFAYTGPSLDEAVARRAVRVARGVVITDVEDLRDHAQRGLIRIRWTRPTTAAAVRVFKSARAAVRDDPDAQVLFEDARDDLVADSDVESGVTYHYLVVAVNEDGVSAPGVALPITIPVAARPVDDLSVTTRLEHGYPVFDLTWTQAPGCEVRVFHRPDDLPPTVSAGEVMAREEMAALQLGEQTIMDGWLAGDRMVLESVEFPDDRLQAVYVPVTLTRDQAAIGTPVKAYRVDIPRNVELVDRVDWQLLRFDWPTGADLVEMVGFDPGVDPVWAAARAITRADWDRDGGATFCGDQALPPHPHDVAVRGVKRSGPRGWAGPAVTIGYAGRWLIAWTIAQGKKGIRSVELQSLWPDDRVSSPPLYVRVVHHPDRLPMTPQESGGSVLEIRRQGRDFSPLEVPVGALPVRGVVTLGEIRPPDGGFTRVFLDRADLVRVPVIAVVEPPLLVAGRPRRVPAPRLLHNQVRCRHCLAVEPRFPQVFACTNLQCPDRGSAGEPHHFQVVANQPTRRNVAQLVTVGECNACRTRSDQEICKSCKRPQSRNWLAADPMPVAMAGAKTTGKSVFAYVGLSQVQNRVARDMGATVDVFDTETATRFATLRALFRGQKVPVSTGGEEGYQPFALTLNRPDDGPRQRLLALNDLSGDWVQKRDLCANYADQLARSGGIVFLIDITQIPEVAVYLQDLAWTLGEEDRRDPIDSLQNIVAVVRNRLGLAAGAKIDVPLAVTVSKLDTVHLLMSRLQEGAGPRAVTGIRPGFALTRDPYGDHSHRGLYDQADGWWVDQEVRSLLYGLGVQRLLEVVGQHFAYHRYFAVSALGHNPPKFGGVKGFAPYRVDEPFRWLLAERW